MTKKAKRRPKMPVEWPGKAWLIVPSFYWALGAGRQSYLQELQSFDVQEIIHIARD
jgi:hypothetical protein